MPVARNQGPPVADPKKIKDAHKGGKVSSEKGRSKQSMAVDAKLFKISKKKVQDAKSFTSQDKAKWKSILKKRQEKKYPFLDSSVASMLDELLKSKVIEPPEMKRPEESDKCFKYSRNGQVKTVVADSKPFSSVESYYVDTKFYLSDTENEEVKCHSPRKPADGERKSHTPEKFD
ncbi:hypothetical protein CCACVL1_09415 [Corchorus capsularis]|uniref:Uncharacterized protein n=1 Tax=Corchorus capsularis TaxID=210143 RepID=A0A1R3IW94_COCAP|nr:hypothetical protein CCACVL1_09415 [Corchorus capsularis]